MCGIAGYFSKNNNQALESFLAKGIARLAKRGPDLQQACTLSTKVGFAHARLSIIDTSSVAHQPMHDSTGRFTIIFNGEIFNFRELKEAHLQGVAFNSHSDTEVLLQLYMKMGKACLNELNGFFSFAIYDKVKEEIFLARDRYGIKPMLFYSDENMILFGSEMKALLEFPVRKEIDFSTLGLYLQLNYVPGNYCMLKGFTKLPPAHCAVITAEGELITERYYSIPYNPGHVISAEGMNYESAKTQLKTLVEAAVERRLVSDVPLGAFLSGGIDSSIVTACASKHVKSLNTFSIGYKDEPFFDETQYANLVANKFKTNHTVFSVSNADMFNCIFKVLDYTDEPFADSSAIAVYILSQQTRQRVTVALSGDGGDELFAGYNKHKAEDRAGKKNLLNTLAGTANPLLKLLPKSRHSKFSNLFRQLQRYSDGVKMSRDERYWRWCSLSTRENALLLLQPQKRSTQGEIIERTQALTRHLKTEGDLNDILFADTQMVLPNDMLTKVDLMSMANCLEVRVPLLDYTVVNFAFSLPVAFKLQAGETKRILKDSFRQELPPELFNRPKHGFEVPLLKWLRTDLWQLIDEDLLSKKFIEEQGIFDALNIEALKQKLKSNNPGDSHATVWALVVFQYWYKKYFA
ncbi:MAG: asparagine synthase (glutamine-hydrolyzing) [Chitinophagales bacterium]